MTDHLLSLPLELLEYALTFAKPHDIAAISLTCKALHTLTSADNVYFWRCLYLAQPYDDPRTLGHNAAAATFDWRGVLTRRVHAERNKTDLAPFLNAVAECVRNAPPFSTSPSADIAWAGGLVSQRIEVFEDDLPHKLGGGPEGRGPDIKIDLALIDRVAAEQRMFIRAAFVRLLRPEGAAAAARRRAARTFVYNMCNYDSSTLWGPLVPGAHGPSWMHIDALISVVSANLRDFGPEWPSLLQPPALLRGAETLRAYSAAPAREKSTIDWAGVEGEWMRIVCFCDYRDLMRFNRGHCRPEFFHDEFEEATRMLRMHITVTGIAEDEISADPAKPALRFEGRMRGFSSQENDDRRVHGVVRVMPSGDIRWSSVSVFQGVRQWSSEGVQLGGPGSAAGIIGVWSGASHDAGDPAGPYWMFRTGDESIMDKIQAWPL